MKYLDLIQNKFLPVRKQPGRASRSDGTAGSKLAHACSCVEGAAAASAASADEVFRYALSYVSMVRFRTAALSNSQPVGLNSKQVPASSFLKLIGTRSGCCNGLVFLIRRQKCVAEQVQNANRAGVEQGLRKPFGQAGTTGPDSWQPR